LLFQQLFDRESSFSRQKKSTMRLFFFSCLLAVSLTTAQAQVTAPQPSPLAKLEQKVGLADVTLEFSRPSAKGRVVFGDLVAFGEIWRFGANGSTKISVSEDAIIGGQKVPKGKYSVFAIPTRESWTVIINKNLELWGTDDYTPELDVCRFQVKPTVAPMNVETMAIDIMNLNDMGGEIVLMWENTMVSFPISFDTDSKVLASIKKTMDGPSAGDFYQAAGYYLSNNKDLTQALDWTNRAIEKGGEKYWYLRRKALIQAGLGDFKSAIETARRSTELAKADGDASYVRQNEKSIAEWTGKLK
jgi:Protein of unknown function (DUF2911)